MRKQQFLSTLFISSVAALLAPEAFSEDGKGTLTLALENDLFGAGTDRHYTHGTEITYASDTYQPEWALKGASLLPLYEPTADTRFIFSLGQQIYTPGDTQRIDPIPDDRPYAGWLYFSMGLLTDNRAQSHYVDKLDFVVGYVGPDSGAESVQRTVHKITDSEIAKGWDNQLHHEATFDLQYQREWTLPIIANNVDVVPHIGFTLGTSQRNIGTGFSLRVGSGLDSDLGPPLIRPSAVGSHYFKPSQRFYWYLFGGANGRYVEHNIFLDGNTDHDSLSVRKNSWVGDIQAGLVAGWSNWRFTLTEILRTREFEQQKDADEFGAIGISYRF